MKRLLALIVLGYLATGIARIGPDERAVVRRFGRVVAQPGPGLWIGGPWGIDRLDRVAVSNVQRVTVNAEDSLRLTGDQNLVRVQVHLDFAVAAGTDSLTAYVLHRDRVPEVLMREADTALTEWLAGHGVDEVLLRGSAALPTWLEMRVQERLEPHGLGVQVLQASVATLAPPDEVRNAFEEVNRAQTQLVTQTERARQRKDEREREASAERYRLRTQTEASVSAKRTQALAEAEVFTRRAEAFRKLEATDPTALQALWWDEVSRIWRRVRERGRIDVIDPYLGPEGLEIERLIPPRGR